MTLANLPVWPFEPNWNSSVNEILEWLTDVLMSPSGAEQRRSMREHPKQTLNFSITVEGNERSLLDNMLLAHATREWYVPIWFDVTMVTGEGTTSFIPCEPSSALKVGTALFVKGSTPYDYQISEIVVVNQTGITISPPVSATLPIGTILHPMRVGRLVETPEITAMTNSVESAEPQFTILEKPADAVVTVRDAGPMIMNGLIVNAYHQETGRGGYFHHNSGTSEGQFIFIYALYLAYEQLREGNEAERDAAIYYKTLAAEMLDAIGKGTDFVGPMLRQPVPDNVDTITLMHWLFAARGDIPGQQIVTAYEVPRTGGTLRIPANAGGGSVFNVWKIYPGTSALLYDSPFSPAFDIAAPGARTDLTVTNWTISGGETVITIPAEAPVHSTWKVVYGYSTNSIIPQGQGFEAYPNWTRIPPGYSACAPDTFRWFEQAMQKAIEHDDRHGKAEAWTALQLAMRRTAVKGQNITDLREVIEPMIGFDAIPTSGAPDGMYCYTNRPDAKGPPSGGDPGWTGYDYWSRNDLGNIVGKIPSSASVYISQIGRGFADQWRVEETYQDADRYLYVKMSVSRALLATEHVRIYLSSTQSYDPATRWFADLPAFTPGSTTQQFFIPRTAFRLATNTLNGNATTWGTALPAGSEIQNFGVEVASQEAIGLEIEKLRLVSDNTAAAVAGAKMPFFPGAMPFAINADLKRQRFVGWNGSPFHGYQLPDHWWWLSGDAIAVHSGKDENDFPVPDEDGSLIYPISRLTGGGATKPIRAMLMEQQLLFLLQAKAKYAADGGPTGFFAHTFVLNTPARASLGNPRPHTWVYVNDDPNTRWVGYQTRIVESLAELVWLTRNSPAFEDAKNLADALSFDWLAQLAVQWPNLNGKVVSGKRIYGMPTDFPDPAISGPQTLYEEPHAAAHILRACVVLKKAGASGTVLYDTLMLRCWQYLEMMWRTSGEMKYTWSPDPAAKQWYGFWHGDIIATLAVMLDNPNLLVDGISVDTVALRLVQTKEWIEEWGVGRLKPNDQAGLVDVYRGSYVLTLESDWTDDVKRGQQRLTDDFVVPVGRPVMIDTANRPFPTQSHRWVLDGKEDHDRFYALIYALKGRAMSLWVPTWMNDMQLAQPIFSNSSTITVGRCGFTAAGGPQPEREDIMIELFTGERIYRRITQSALDSMGQETLLLDKPIAVDIETTAVFRICFMSLMRLDQDSVEVSHITDLNGVSEAEVIFRAAPDIRVPESASYEG